MELCHFGHFYIAHFLMHGINLKFHIWIPHENIVDTYFFSYQD